jgi:hypothetical protein
MFKKIEMIAMAGLALAGTANAGTDFNFSAATDGSYRCTNYCVGFTTDDGVDTVSYVDLSLVSTSSTSLKVTSIINGDTYVGVAPGSGQQFMAADASGTYALLSVTWMTKMVRIGSGRGQHTTTYRYTNGGAVLFP